MLRLICISTTLLLGLLHSYIFLKCFLFNFRNVSYRGCCRFQARRCYTWIEINIMVGRALPSHPWRIFSPNSVSRHQMIRMVAPGNHRRDHSLISLLSCSCFMVCTVSNMYWMQIIARPLHGE